MDPPRLTVFSTPLVATWVLDETDRVMFDVGDGATALLEGKIHKADVVAITHGHRDHVGGLPQFMNLRAGVAAANGERLRVVHPEGSGSVMALGRFLSGFDTATTGMSDWQSVRPGDKLELADGKFLRGFATKHIPGPDNGGSRTRSLGFQVGRTVERLRPDLRGRPQAEIDSKRKEKGREGITCREEEVLFAISGDTTSIDVSEFGGAPCILHECTFLDDDAGSWADARGRGHEHSCLSDVLDLACAARIDHLALYHISKRYTDDEIIKAVRAGCAKRELTTQVSVALPGRVYYDLFSHVIWPLKGV